MIHPKGGGGLPRGGAVITGGRSLSPLSCGVGAHAVARDAAGGVGGVEEGRSTVRPIVDAIVASLAEMRPDLLPQWALVAVTLLLVLFTVRAMREQTTATARALSAEMLLLKSAQWDSDAMKVYRRKAAGCLLKSRVEDIPEQQVDPVLDFFEGLGTVVRSGLAPIW
jgi:hypothetical protein